MHCLRLLGLDSRASRSQPIGWQQRRMRPRLGSEREVQLQDDFAGTASEDGDTSTWTPEQQASLRKRKWRMTQTQLTERYHLRRREREEQIGDVTWREREEQIGDVTWREREEIGDVTFVTKNQPTYRILSKTEVPPEKLKEMEDMAEDYYGIDIRDRKTPFTLTHDEHGNEVKTYHNPPPALSRDQIDEKYLEKYAKKLGFREKVLSAPYGQVRLDEENPAAKNKKRQRKNMEKERMLKDVLLQTQKELEIQGQGVATQDMLEKQVPAQPKKPKTERQLKKEAMQRAMKNLTSQQDVQETEAAPHEKVLTQRAKACNSLNNLVQQYTQVTSTVGRETNQATFSRPKEDFDQDFFTSDTTVESVGSQVPETMPTFSESLTTSVYKHKSRAEMFSEEETRVEVKKEKNLGHSETEQRTTEIKPSAIAQKQSSNTVQSEEQRMEISPPRTSVQSAQARSSAVKRQKVGEFSISGEQFNPSSAPNAKNFEALYPETEQDHHVGREHNATEKSRNVFGNHARENQVYETVTKQIQRQENVPTPNLDKPVTAYDLVRKLRREAHQTAASSAHGASSRNDEKKTVAQTHPSLAKWKGRVDTQGFRILKDQVLDLQYETRDVVASILKESIIFMNDDLIAIDKPYGLASHGGPGIHHSVGRLLPELAGIIQGQSEPLHLIHRLDKQTTGVMLLARNASTAWKVHGMFKRREVGKTYWALTKGVPNPHAGILDIPMAEGKVKGRARMMLRPHRDENTKLLKPKARKVSKMAAITEYKVLSSMATAALVQCTPSTGIKHQIRCHLAFGLNTPILGDHKYSHYSDIKPQKLHPEILDKLKIRQAKVRYVPMHLHARELVLPEFYEGRNTIFRAQLPRFFLQNMKWLKLALPK